MNIKLKGLLVLALLCFKVTENTHAQVLFEEDFEGENPLDGFTIIETEGGIPYQGTIFLDIFSESLWAVGDYVHVLDTNKGVQSCTYLNDPNMVSDNYLILPQIQMPEDAANYFLQFHAQSMGTNSFLDPYRVLISTTSNTKEALTDTIFDNPEGAPNIFGEQIMLDLSAYAGQAIYIGFHSYGHDDFALILDNMYVGKIFSLDADGQYANFQESYVKGDTLDVSATFSNVGSDTLTSVRFNYQVDDNPVQSTTIENLAFRPLSVFQFNHMQELIFSTPGTFAVKLWLDQLNGQEDEQHDNDTITYTYTVDDNAVKRIPLIEVFSSATCAPCKGFNETLKPSLELFKANQAGEAKVTMIKYAMNGPGIGDLFYNDHVGSRASYYGSNTIPAPFLDGVDFNGTESEIEQASFVPAHLELSASHQVENGEVSVSVSMKALQAIPQGAKLHVALLNASYEAPSENHDNFTNEETEFHHVLRQLIPVEGTTLQAFAENETVTKDVNTSYTLLNEFPAQGDFGLINADIEVVAFVQDADGNVLQSTTSSGTTQVGFEEINSNSVLQAFPNPAHQHVNLILGVTNQPVQLTLFDINGRQLSSQHAIPNHAGILQVSVDHLPVGIYKGVINTNNHIYNFQFVKTEAN